MSHYFECNLNPKVPKNFHPHIYQRLVDTIELIHERTDKLNEALEFDCVLKGCKTPGPTFAKLAKSIFDISHARFDSMTPAELAEMVDMLYDGNDAPERIEWPNAEVVYDTAFVTIKDWECLRHLGIGGSDSAVIMGISPFQSEEGLFYDKLGYPELVSDASRQVFFDRGHFMEDKVIEKFCELVGATRIPETRMFRSKKYPNSTANIDAVLRMQTGKLAIFEAKSVSRGTEGGWMGKKIPPYYVTQCHQYIGVLNDPRIEGAYIGAIPVGDVTLDGTYIGSTYGENEFFHHFIEPDAAVEEEILEAEHQYWETYIVNGVKPAPSLDPTMDKNVAVTYRPSPLSDENIVPPTLSYEDHAEMLERMLHAEQAYSDKSAELKQIEKERDLARLGVTELLEGAQAGVFVDVDGKPIITVKNALQKGRVTFDAKKLQQDYPTAYEATKKEGKPFTRFSYKEHSN